MRRGPAVPAVGWDSRRWRNAPLTPESGCQAAQLVDAAAVALAPEKDAPGYISMTAIGHRQGKRTMNSSGLPMGGAAGMALRGAGNESRVAESQPTGSRAS